MSKYGLKRLACLASTIVFLALVVVTPVYADDGSIYVVQPGDTLLRIAARYNLTATQLATANGLRWNAWVYVGQRLRIPGQSSVPSASTTASPGGTYVVYRGDTLIGIAARHRVTVNQLAQANGLRTNAWVYIGQRLKIPGEPSTPTNTAARSAWSVSRIYIVHPGDTLIGIAARYRVTVNKLAMDNGLFANAWVYTGQQLKIPDQSTAQAASTPSATPTAAPATSTPSATPTTPATSTPTATPTAQATPTATPVAASSTNSTYVVRPGDTLSKIAVRHGVGISRLAAVNGLHTNSWVYTGQRLSIPGTATAASPTVAATGAPAAQSHAGKWIDVNLSTQTVTAYSGQTALRSFVVSTGTRQHPTVVGTFSVYVKYASTRMVGPGYNLPNVPYTMYFYRGYALHGTYWHNNFGTPMSHGCVNLATPDAQWLYNWTPVGTKVVTHY